MTDQPANDQFHASSFLPGPNGPYVEQMPARFAAQARKSSRSRAGTGSKVPPT